jgi:hypothetical protein
MGRCLPATPGLIMQLILKNTRALELLVNLNWDRLLALGVIFGSLLVGAWWATPHP